MGLIAFFKGLFSKDTVEKIDAAVGEIAVETGRAVAQAEVDRALDKLLDEAQQIGDPARRAAMVAAIASLRAAVTGLIATIGATE